MIGDAQVPGEVDDRLCHRVNAISLYEEGNNQNGGRKGENPKARDRGNDRGSSDAAGQKKISHPNFVPAAEDEHVHERRGGGTRAWP